MRLNPDGGYLYFLLLGRTYLLENDVEQALINLRAALMRNPTDIETRVYRAAALVAAGDGAGAKWEAKRDTLGGTGLLNEPMARDLPDDERCPKGTHVEALGRRRPLIARSMRVATSP
jgi:hypothetical protein